MATSAGSAAFEQGRAEAGRGQAGQLDRAGGDLAVGQRAQVAAQAAALARAAQVVEHAEGQPAEAGDGEGIGGGPRSFLALPGLPLAGGARRRRPRRR